MAPQTLYRIGVLSDTHGTLHPRIFTLFAGVDLILHAGDLGADTLVPELEAIAPLKAVAGNVDGEPYISRLPRELKLTTPLGRIAMTHGHLSNASAYRTNEMLAHFRDFAPRILIYGHTHLPELVEREGIQLFNPGAAGRVRAGGRPAMVGLISGTGPDHPLHIEQIVLDDDRSGPPPL